MGARFSHSSKIRETCTYSVTRYVCLYTSLPISSVIGCVSQISACSSDLHQPSQSYSLSRVHLIISCADPAARARMFQIHIGQTPHNLVSSDFKLLGAKTDGFSGSDISVLVRDALYEPGNCYAYKSLSTHTYQCVLPPCSTIFVHSFIHAFIYSSTHPFTHTHITTVRTCQMATHFRKVTDTEGKQAYLLEPCSPGMAGAIEMSLMDDNFPSDKLKPLDVTMRHFEHILTSSKPSVGADDLEQLEKWTEQFGQEGV